MNLHDHAHAIAINTKFRAPGPTKLKVWPGNEASLELLSIAEEDQ
jgi:hypothetical protein